MIDFNRLFLTTLGLGLLAGGSAYAQTGVGTGSTAPRTMLDVNGAIAVTETTAAVSGNAATIPTGFSLVRLTGSATAPVALTGASSPAPVAGQQLVIYNTTTFPATFAGQTVPAASALAFVYSNGGWQGSAGGANGLTASNGLNKAGSNVALGGALTQATSISNITSANPLSFTSPTAADAAVTVGNTAAGAGRVQLGNANHGIQRDLTGSTGGAANDVAVYTSQASVHLVANPNTTGNTSLPLGQLTLTPTGRVGLGTTTPAANLDVVSSSGATQLGLRNAAAYDHLYVTNDGYGPAFYAGGAETGMRFNVGASSTGTYGDASQNYTEGLRITPGGQVGIGGIAPAASLHVNGGLALAETTSPALTGANPAYLIPADVSQVRLVAGGTAPTGTVALTATGPVAGQRLAVYNGTAIAATLGGQTIPAAQAVEFVYSNGAWRTLGDGGASALTALTASNGLTKTGANVVLGGALTQATTINAGSFPLAVTGLNNTSATFGTGGGIVMGSTLNSAGSTGVQRLEFTSNSDPNAAIGHTTQNQEVNDLYLYSGDNLDTTYGPDRIRLVAPSIMFQSINANGGVNNLANAESNTNTTTNMFIGANGNVGIGTAAPAAKLHLVTTGGSGGADDDLNLDSYSGTGVDGGNIIFRHSRGTLAAPANLASGDLAFALDARPYYNGAFQGPSSYLYSNYVGSGTTNLTNLRFGTSGAEQMRISETGNVGIGTTTPTEKLEVDGNIRLGANGGNVTGAGNVIEFVGPGINTDNMGIYRYNTAADASELRVAMGDNGGTVDRFALGMASNGTVGTIASTTWTPVTSFYTDGKLGVNMGAAVPTSTLQVSGDIKAGTDAIGNARLVPGSASQAGYLSIYKGDGTTRLGYIGYDNNNMFYNVDDAANGFHFFNNRPIYGYRGGVAAAPATSGTTQPGLLMRLHSAFKLSLDFGGNTVNGNWIQSTSNDNLGEYWNLALEPNGGNVGIGLGTAGPSARLHVGGNVIAGSVAAGTVRLNPGTASQAGFMEVFKGDGGTRLGYIGYDNADLTYVAENGAQHVFSGGNVGIGTSDPTSPLHIGSTGWSANQLHFSSGWGTAGYHATIGSGYAGTTAGGIMLGTPHIPWRAGYGAKFRFASDQAATNYWDMGMNGEGGGSTDRFDINRQGVSLVTVNNAGRVGIGTTSPSGKLHVEDNVNGPTFSYVRNLNSGTGAYSIHALGNDGGFSTVLFLNSSTRTADGGINTATFRNDAGDLRIQGGSPSLGSSGIMVKGTSNNVGIGTSTPVNTLHVDNGAANSYTSFLIANQGAPTSGNLPFGNANRDGIQAIVGNNGANSELYIQRSGGGSAANLYLSKNGTLGATAGSSYSAFYYSGNLVGTIALNGTSGVVYNTTSDVRLKENIRPTAYGLADVMKVQVRDYNYKTDKATPQTGFIAQQLYDVFPVAVTKGGDDAKTNPWTVDYSKLTPLLTKAIQEEQTEIEALKAANARLVAENAALKASLDGKASASTLDELQAALRTLRAEVQGLRAGGTTASASLR